MISSIIPPRDINIAFTDASCDSIHPDDSYGAFMLYGMLPHVVLVPYPEFNIENGMTIAGNFDWVTYAEVYTIKECSEHIGNSRPYTIYTDNMNIVNLYKNVSGAHKIIYDLLQYIRREFPKIDIRFVPGHGKDRNDIFTICNRIVDKVAVNTRTGRRINVSFGIEGGNAMSGNHYYMVNGNKHECIVDLSITVPEPSTAEKKAKKRAMQNLKKYKRRQKLRAGSVQTIISNPGESI